MFEQQCRDWSALDRGRRRRVAKVWWWHMAGLAALGQKGPGSGALGCFPWRESGACGVICEDHALQRDQGDGSRAWAVLEGELERKPTAPTRPRASPPRGESFCQPPRPGLQLPSTPDGQIAVLPFERGPRGLMGVVVVDPGADENCDPHPCEG